MQCTNKGATIPSLRFGSRCSLMSVGSASQSCPPMKSAVGTVSSETLYDGGVFCDDEVCGGENSM